MSMLSGSVLGSSGDGPRRRHPVATGILVLLMMLVLFGATYGAVRLLKGGDSTPDASASTPAPCVTTTVKPVSVLPKPATVTVNVYNATDRAGLARKTSLALRARGFVIGQVANDPLGKSLTNVAEIRYGLKGRDAALLVRYNVVGGTLVLDQRNDATVDLVLGLKFNGLTDPKKVAAALAKPVVVATGSGCTASPTPTRTGTATATAKPTKTASPTH